MFKGIFAHYLFEHKGISAGPAEFCLRLDKDTMFIDIVHPAAQPTFVIGGKGKIISLRFGSGIPWLLHRALDPYIIIIIGIGVPQDEVNIIKSGRILVFYSKIDPGFEAAFPLLTGNGDILFKNVRREGTGRPLQAERCKQDKKLFQKIIFLQNKFKTMGLNRYCPRWELLLKHV